MIYITAFSNSCAKMLGEEIYPIAGNPATFDPIASIPDVTAKAGSGATLVKLEIRSIRSDGTMDLTASYSPPPTAQYEFQRKLSKAPEGKTEPPIGAGRGVDDVWVEEVRIDVVKPGQRRHVMRRSGMSSAEYDYTTEGMEVSRSSRMRKPDPSLNTQKLSIKQMWDTAIKIGAPRDAVATVEYWPDRTTFEISGASIDLRWDKNGKLETNMLSDDQLKKLGLNP